MTVVVVDATVVVAALTAAGEDGQWAESIMAGGSLAAPILLLVESANVLRHLERGNNISTLEANSAHRDLLRLDVELFHYDPFALRVWELRHDVSGYDAWYVALPWSGSARYDSYRPFKSANSTSLSYLRSPREYANFLHKRVDLSDKESTR